MTIERDATEVRAAYQKAAHILTALGAQLWTSAAIEELARYGSLIRDMCQFFARELEAQGTADGEQEFRRLAQVLWNASRADCGRSMFSLFPPAQLDPKLVVLRHLFDTARRIANPKPHSDQEWADAIGFYEKHTKDALPADKPHTLCDPTADSSTLWSLLLATGASVTNEIPELRVAWYRNVGAMPTTMGLCCAEVWLLSTSEIPDGRTLEELEESADADFYRADLSTALSLLLMQPHLLKPGRLYIFSGVSRPHQGEDQYPMAMGGTRPHCWFGRPKPGESYISVRLEK